MNINFSPSIIPVDQAVRRASLVKALMDALEVTVLQVLTKISHKRATSKVQSLYKKDCLRNNHENWEHHSLSSNQANQSNFYREAKKRRNSCSIKYEINYWAGTPVNDWHLTQDQTPYDISVAFLHMARSPAMTTPKTNVHWSLRSGRRMFGGSIQLASADFQVNSHH